MRHTRSDYDPIQDPRPNGIGADEPVFILRAQDILAPSTVRFYVRGLRGLGAQDEMIRGLEVWADEMAAWQAAHRAKHPDVPPGAMDRTLGGGPDAAGSEARGVES